MKQFAALRAQLSRVGIDSYRRITPADVDAWKKDLVQAIEACYEYPWTALATTEFNEFFPRVPQHIRANPEPNSFYQDLRRTIIIESCRPLSREYKSKGDKVSKDTVMGFRTVVEATFAGFVQLYCDPVDAEKARLCVREKRIALAEAFRAKDVQLMINRFAQAIDPTHALILVDAEFAPPRRLMVVDNRAYYEGKLPHLRPMTVTKFRVEFNVSAKQLPQNGPAATIGLDGSAANATWNWEPHTDDSNTCYRVLELVNAHESVKTWTLQIDEAEIVGEIEPIFTAMDFYVAKPLHWPGEDSKALPPSTQVVVSPGTLVSNSMLQEIVEVTLRRFPAFPQKKGTPKFTFLVNHAVQGKASVIVASSGIECTPESFVHNGVSIKIIAPQSCKTIACRPAYAASIMTRFMLLQAVVAALGVVIRRLMPQLAKRNILLAVTSLCLSSIYWAPRCPPSSKLLLGGVEQMWTAQSSSDKKRLVWALANALQRIEAGGDAAKTGLVNVLSQPAAPLFSVTETEISSIIDQLIEFKKDHKNELLTACISTDVQWFRQDARDEQYEDRFAFGVLLLALSRTLGSSLSVKDQDALRAKLLPLWLHDHQIKGCETLGLRAVLVGATNVYSASSTCTEDAVPLDFEGAAQKVHSHSLLFANHREGILVGFCKDCSKHVAADAFAANHTQ